MDDARENGDSRQPSPIVDILVTALICVVAPLIAAVFWVAEWRWVWLGALSWVIGLLVKVPLDGLVDYLLKQRPAAARASASGLVSAVSELGVAAAVFVTAQPPADPLNAILTFAVAGGVTEAALLLALIPFQRPEQRVVESWVSHAKASRLIRYQMFVERTITLAGHIGARGLFIVAIHARVWPLLALPVLTFAAVDGLASYGFHVGWDWCEPGRARRFYGACAGIAITELAVMVIAIWIVI